MPGYVSSNSSTSSGLDLAALQALLQRPLLPHSGLNAPFQLEVHSFDRLASTNQTLWELLRQTGKEGTVAIARQQTAGKGQRGRRWQSPPGGLYLSIALCPDLAARRAGELMVCSAWGIAIALRHYQIPVLLKWPNDLVINARKLGGILLETRSRGDRVQQAVVGVGINWANPVPPMGINLQHPAIHSSSLAPLGQPPPPIASIEMLAAVTLHGLMTGYQFWQHYGIDRIRPAYEALLSGLGRVIPLPARLHQADGPSHGQIAGITPLGQLRVRPLHLQETLGREQPELVLDPGDVRLGYGAECPKESQPTHPEIF
ncbi:MAG: biotin--[acetyl-CoA-carboxylase] ligase [Elainellaceae cyanobacterium]